MIQRCILQKNRGENPKGFINPRGVHYDGRHMSKIWLKSAFRIQVLGFSLAACAQMPTRVSVMTYNVENLFNTTHDAGKNDETFLPQSAKATPVHRKKCAAVKVKKWRVECLKLDWNQTILAQKIDRLAQVIRSVNDERGADIVFLQEVENIEVLQELLRRGGLDKLGYHAVLIEGADKRGIDVAVLSKFKIMESKLFNIPFKNIGDRVGDTRGILNVQVLGPLKTTFSLLAVHLPAPFHPTELRRQALEYLDELGKAESALGRVVISAGDFNITAEEQRTKKILDPYRNHWMISHLDACQNCKGSTYYARDKTWSFLDQIWIYKPLKRWELDVASVRVVNTASPEQMQSQGARGPLAFAVSADGKSSTGISDHWPIYLELSIPSK